MDVLYCHIAQETPVTNQNLFSFGSKTEKTQEMTIRLVYRIQCNATKFTLFVASYVEQ